MDEGSRLARLISHASPPALSGRPRRKCRLPRAPPLNYTSTAWPGNGSDPTNDPSRANPQINITLDGSVVTSGAYTAPTYSFSGSVPVTGKDAGT